MERVLVGLVGYYGFVRGYPLGPALRDALEALAAARDGVEIREMNWGPIAIVQALEASAERFDRVVLAAAVDRGRAHGVVATRRWTGGRLDAGALQERVFEAVTGVVSVDNLLVIGEHFGVWPPETVVVEAQIPDDAIGRLVLDELAAAGESRVIVGERAPSDEARGITRALTGAVTRAVDGDAGAIAALGPLGVADLGPVARFCKNRFVSPGAPAATESPS